MFCVRSGLTAVFLSLIMSATAWAQTPAPTIQSISPTTLIQGLRASATIFGSNLGGVTAVTFSGTGVTATIGNVIASRISITISVTANAAEGARTVTVATPGGTASYSSLFIYKPAVITPGIWYENLGAISGLSTLRENRFAARFQFVLSQPQAVTLDVQSPGFDPYLYLLAADGSVITSNDDGPGTVNALINADLAAGTYIIEVTSYDVSSVGNFSLAFGTGGLPIVKSIFPSFGMQGATMNATIDGTNLSGATEVTFSGGGVTGVIGSGRTSSSLPVTITVAPDATVSSFRTVTVRNAAGAGSKEAFAVIPQATITSVAPSAASPGTTLEAVIRGSNLSSATAVTFSGSGVTGLVHEGLQADFVAVTVTVAPSAQPGIRSVTVTTASGTSQTFNGFTIANRTPLTLSWKVRASFDETRSGTGSDGAATSLIGTKIYASHRVRSGESVLMSIYDITSNKWTHGGPDAPDGRYLSSASAATAMGRHYVLGVPSTPNGTTAIDEFDPSTRLWRTRAPLTAHRYAFGLATLSDKIYVIGGYATNGAFGLNQVFDASGNTWSNLASMPVPVSSNYATIGLNGKIYVFGGYTLDTGRVTAIVQIYDVGTNAWSLGTPLPTPRGAPHAGVIGGQIVVFGGFDAGNLPLYITEFYDPPSNTWTLGPEMIESSSTDVARGMTFDNNRIFTIVAGRVQVLDSTTNARPTITSVSPRLAARGTTITATLIGTNLSGATSLVFSPPGLIATILSGGTATSLAVQITIPNGAPTGEIGIVVNTPTGTSDYFNAYSVPAIQIIAGSMTAIPTLSGFKQYSFSNTFPTWTVTQGLASGFGLVGTNLETVTSVNISGIGVSSQYVSAQTESTLATGIFVAPFATLGSHALTVTSSAGVSAPLSGLTVRAPATLTSGVPQDGSFNSFSGVSKFPGRSYAERFQFTIAGESRDAALEVRSTTFFPALYLISPSGTVVNTTGVNSNLDSPGWNATLQTSLVPGTYVLEVSADMNVQLSAFGATFTLSLTMSPTGSPRLTSLSPPSGPRGSRFPLGITGVNLAGATVVTFSGTGVTAEVAVGGTDTFLPVTVTTAPDAALSYRSVAVTTPVAASVPLLGFLVTESNAPSIRGVLPAASAPGRTLAARIGGTNLSSVMDVQFSGTGVSATIEPGRTSTLLPITIVVSPDAALGTRSVTIVSTAGTSTLAAFTVVPPISFSLSWKSRPMFADPAGIVDVNGASANLIGTKIYFSHGDRPSFGSTALSIFDITTNAWTYGAPEAPRRASRAAGGTAFGRHYVISEDTSTFNARTLVQEFDPATNTWTVRGQRPFAGRALAGASLGNKIYVLGGRTGTSFGTGDLLGTNQVYDPASDQWTKLRPMSEPVSDNSATIGYNGKIYVFGGATTTAVTGKLQIYDVASDTWTTGTPMPTPRGAAMAGVINDRIAVFGGYDPAFGYLKVTELYDPVSDTWTIGPDMLAPSGEIAQGVTYSNNRIFSLGGARRPRSGYTFSVEILDSTTVALPVITSISPAAARRGATVSATITGTNLSDVTSMVFLFDGLTATVGNGGTSTSVPVTITIPSTGPLWSTPFFVSSATGSSPVFSGFKVTSGNPPAITAIDPAPVIQGIAAPVTISGSDLLGVTAVTFSGTGISATIVSNDNPSATTIAFVVAADAEQGTRSVTVTTPSGTSAPFPFGVTGIPPRMNDITANAPGLSQTAAAYYGGPFTLTVNGEDFREGAIVSVGGLNVRTTFVSPTQLTAQVDTAALSTAGSRDVKVINPGGSASVPVTLKVAVRGDVNSNGSINIGDALVTALAVGGLIKPLLPTAVGDINLGGTVNIGDALSLARFAGRLVIDWPLPQISATSPGTAVRNNTLTLSGTGFSPSVADNQVLFSVVGDRVLRVTPSQGSTTSLTVTVPADAVSGRIQVYRKDVPLGGKEFPILVDGTPMPLLLTDIAPYVQLTPGTTVALTGMGFDNDAANDSVLFTSSAGTVNGSILSASATSLNVSVPNEAVCGPVVVVTGGRTSNSRMVMRSGSTCGLRLSGIWGGASPGETLVLEGVGYDSVSPANNAVRFPASGGGSVTAPVLASGGTLLQVHVPENAVEGNVTVTVGSTTSNAITYRPPPQ